MRDNKIQIYREYQGDNAHKRGRIWINFTKYSSVWVGNLTADWIEREEVSFETEAECFTYATKKIDEWINHIETRFASKVA